MPAAPRLPLNPLLRQRLDESGLTKSSVAFVAGFPNYPDFFETLRSEWVSATKLTVRRLEAVARAVGFPQDQLFLDGVAPPLPNDAPEVQREVQWVARQVARGRAPWTDPAYRAAWLEAFRAGERDYPAWATQRP